MGGRRDAASAARAARRNPPMSGLRAVCLREDCYRPPLRRPTSAVSDQIYDRPSEATSRPPRHGLFILKISASQTVEMQTPQNVSQPRAGDGSRTERKTRSSRATKWIAPPARILHPWLPWKSCENPGWDPGRGAPTNAHSVSRDRFAARSNVKSPHVHRPRNFANPHRGGRRDPGRGGANARPLKKLGARKGAFPLPRRKG